MENRINNDIKTAMLEKAESKLIALRLIKSAIQIEKAKNGINSLSDEQIIKIIQNLMSRSTESASIYAKNEKIDLMDEEIFLISIYKLYLPEQMTEEEITERVKQIISETGATTLRDMGKVMSIVSKEFLGKVDNKSVGSIVKKLLS